MENDAKDTSEEYNDENLRGLRSEKRKSVLDIG